MSKPKNSAKDSREKASHSNTEFSFELPDSTFEAISKFKKLPQGTILLKSGQKFPNDLQIHRGYIHLSSFPLRIAEIFTVKETNKYEIVYEHSSIPFENIRRIVWERTFLEIKT